MGLNEKFFKSAAGGVVATDNFMPVVYSGNGTSSNQITTVGFEPDMIWIKNRTINGENSALVDVLRNSLGNILYPNLTNAEASGGYFTGRSNGFNIGTGNLNISGTNNYIAWCWKAPTAQSIGASGSRIASSIKKNVDAGFSIVSYAGASNSTADTSNNSGAYWSVGHGLDATPDLVIVKKTNAAGGWYVGGAALGSTGSNGNHLVLNSSAAQAGEANILWGGSQTFNDTTFGLGGWDVVNRNGDSYIAYCFTSITGYQKVGTYVGNGSTGQSITTGFEPSFLLIRKADDSQNWIMLDNVRDSSNPKTKTLLADTSGAETVTTQNLSFTSTGFTLSNFHVNDNGTTFIYLAIA